MLGDEGGSALVELAVVLSIVGVPMLLGTVYTASLLYDSSEVASAAHAGAVYGMTGSNAASDNANIIAAAQAEASDFGANLTVTPTLFYACASAVGGTQYSTAAAASAACASSHALQFIQVVASVPVTPLGSVPGMQKTVTLSSASVMVVQE
jgi:Flp pilus assembly protein TadG